MHMQKSQKGAFLIISMILLIVLSGLGIATMTLVTTDNRTTRNYSNYIDAKSKADLHLQSLRLKIENLNDWPIPATCNLAKTCGFLARGQLPQVYRSAKDNDWWADTAQELSLSNSFEHQGKLYYFIEEWSAWNVDLTHYRIYRIISYSSGKNNLNQVTAEDFITKQYNEPPPVIVNETFNWNEPLPSWLELKPGNGTTWAGSSQWGNGWGIQERVTSWPALPQELAYDPVTGQSQSLTFESEKAFTEMTVHFAAFSGSEGEQGVYQLYDEEGAPIGSPVTFHANDTGGGLTINPGEKFYSIKFYATGYSPPNPSVENNGYDSSDYLINRIDSKVVE